MRAWTPSIPDDSGPSRRAVLWRTAGLALLCAVPAACRSADAPARPAGPPDFSGAAPIALDVARLELEQRYRAPGAYPNVEQDIAWNPSELVRQWATQRLRPVGTTGSARVIILQASVVVEELARSAGLTGLFSQEPDQRFMLDYDVQIDAANPEKGLGGSATAQVRRTATLGRSATAADREALLLNLVADGIKDLAGELEQNITTYLAPFLRR